MELEREFVSLERSGVLSAGRRLQPLFARSATNTLIWEAEFPTAELALAALAQVAADPTHARLFQQQAQDITDSHVELFDVLELGV